MTIITSWAINQAAATLPDYGGKRETKRKQNVETPLHINYLTVRKTAE